MSRKRAKERASSRVCSGLIEKRSFFGAFSTRVMRKEAKGAVRKSRWRRKRTRRMEKRRGKKRL